MKIMEPKVMQDFEHGIIQGEQVEVGSKKWKDIRQIYKNPNVEMDDDTLMYRVYSYSQSDPSIKGNLNWGLTVMMPMTINGECNMTRGHFHQDLDCAEIYFGLQGEGILLLMDESGNCLAEKMKSGSVHHIDGKLAHRVINTGNTELHFGACWPTVSGHDYKRIEDFPFTQRIYKENGEIITKPF